MGERKREEGIKNWRVKMVQEIEEETEEERGRMSSKDEQARRGLGNVLCAAKNS